MEINFSYWALICWLILPLDSLYAGVSSSGCRPQEPETVPEITLSEFRPKSQLKGKSTNLLHAKFPVIDSHAHFGYRLKGDKDALAAYVKTMDDHLIAMSVSLDVKLGDEDSHLSFLNANYQDRFLPFAHIDFQGDGKDDDYASWACNQTGFVRRCCEQLVAAKGKGVVGVKFFKQFGLGYKNADGKLIRIDDSRFDPFWQTCGQLEMPVLIHTGDPAAFFEPIDKTNERYEELSRHPDWSFYGESYPSRQELLEARNRVIARHPNTLFIGAHVAGCPEDLGRVEKWLDKYPNLYVEIASRIAELGRQPYSSREFFLKYQDRVLFGTDGPWPELRLTYYWRFLETKDEYFRYSEKSPPPQGLWQIYGVHLPDPVLRKVYYENFLNIVPSAKGAYEKTSNRLSGLKTKSP